MELTLANKESELLEILKIQKENHVNSLSQESSENNNGFVTVVHTYSTLTKLNAKAKQIIAKKDNRVVGYALVMLKEFKNLIPVLTPMFEAFEKITYNGKKLSELNYYVMGQICIQHNYKRKGIFKLLYKKHQEEYSKLYDYCITEVSSKNIPSMLAHKKLGFKTIHTFTDQTDQWNILLWDWNKNQ